MVAASERSLNKDYSVFKVYVRCSPDPFWQTFFDSLSKGQFPKGFYYDDNLRCIIFTSKKDKSCVEVNSPTSKADTFRSFHLLQNFFRAKGIFSSSDIPLETDEAPKSDFLGVSNWASIKVKSMRKLLIHRYCARLTEMFDLNVSPELLSERIMLMLSFKSIRPADIVIRKGRVVGIKNVYVEADDPEEVTFPKVAKPRKISQTKKEPPPAILQAIERLIRDDRARMVKV